MEMNMERTEQLKKFFKLWTLNIKIERERKEEFESNKREIEDEREYASEYYDEFNDCHYVQYHHYDDIYENEK